MPHCSLGGSPHRGSHGGASLRSPSRGFAADSRADRQPQLPTLWIHHWAHTEATLTQGCSQPMTKLIGVLVQAIPVQCKTPRTGNFYLRTFHQPDRDCLRAGLQWGSFSPIRPSSLLSHMSDMHEGLNLLSAYSCSLPLYPSQTFPPIRFWLTYHPCPASILLPTSDDSSKRTEKIPTLLALLSRGLSGSIPCHFL